MSAIISTMEKNGLLIRKSCEQDSRINYLELTDKGIDMALFLKKDRKVTEDIMLEGITEEDYLLFTEIVNKIRKNLERI
jgi:DNA-binding MarR family transcriptional regulator